jgi:hypothetical protein
MGLSRTAMGVTVLLGLIPLTVSAQWTRYPTAGVPKTTDGKPNLGAPAPRNADGNPDLSGVWGNPPCTRDCPPGTEKELLPLAAQFVDISWGMKEGLPYRPWAAELAKARIADQWRGNPDAHCLPIGVVALHTHPYPRRMIQSPGLLTIVYEKDWTFRQIFTDGHPLPADPQPWWYGYSSGKWVGDTLVVETRGLRDDGWLDFRGNVITGAATITERFRRINYGNLEIELTIDDAKAYTKPWSVKIKQTLLLNTDLFEFFCPENEKDVQHFK